jgi:hypothetical protein
VLQDPTNPAGPANFFITVDGQTPTLFNALNSAVILTHQTRNATDGESRPRGSRNGDDQHTHPRQSRYGGYPPALNRL